MYTEELLESAAKGNHAELTKLVMLWQKRIYNFGLKYFGEHDMAMEITQKTFVTMCTKLHTLKDRTMFKSWLYSIAANYCHDEKRRSARWVQQVDSSTEGSGSLLPLQPIDVHAEDTPDRLYQRAELANLLKRALATLSEEQRVVVIMKEYEGLKFHEIAEILRISENTAKSRLYYGLDNLRKKLQQWNIHKETVSYGI
jgi:RNA polymerase sigma-70 factor (ECF subfamily)